MSASSTQTLALKDFLKLPYLEAYLAWEYVNGVALQKRLLNALNNSSDEYTALPELRCTFGDRSVVPDGAVIAWNRIQINTAAKPEDNFTQAPDGTIEILSPDQTATRVIDNILHCLRHSCKLGWMLDPDERSILMFAPHQKPEICKGDRQLIVIEVIDLALTAQVFD